MHSAGKGKPFTAETNPLGAVTLRAAWAPDTSSFVATGDNGALLFRPSNGRWLPMAAKKSPMVNWRDIHGFSIHSMFAVGRQAVTYYDGKAWREVKTITGLPAARNLRAVTMDRAAGSTRLYLAGEGLLATCTLIPGPPASLTCGP